MEVGEAERLVRLAKTDPAAALKAIPERLQPTTPRFVRARLDWAKGRALFELAQNDEAIEALERATTLAHGSSVQSRIVISLAAALAATDRSTEARSLLQDVIDESHGSIEGALADTQFALLDLSAGDLRTARDRLRRSCPTLDESESDRDAAARARGNLGYCEMQLGAHVRARAAFHRALELAWAAEDHLTRAGCLQNMGYLDALSGELPGPWTRS